MLEVMEDCFEYEKKLAWIFNKYYVIVFFLKKKKTVPMAPLN